MKNHKILERIKKMLTENKGEWLLLDYWVCEFNSKNKRKMTKRELASFFKFFRNKGLKRKKVYIKGNPNVLYRYD